jgi:hypothetical protein
MTDGVLAGVPWECVYNKNNNVWYDALVKTQCNHFSPGSFAILSISAPENRYHGTLTDRSGDDGDAGDSHGQANCKKPRPAVGPPYF